MTTQDGAARDYIGLYIVHVKEHGSVVREDNRSITESCLSSVAIGCPVSIYIAATGNRKGVEYLAQWGVNHGPGKSCPGQ